MFSSVTRSLKTITPKSGRFFSFRTKASGVLNYERQSSNRNFEFSSGFRGKQDSRGSMGGRPGGGRGGNPRFGGRPNPRAAQNPFAKLNFKKTIKIDPEFKKPISEMPFSETTRQVLISKGFHELTPVQSQAYDPVFQGEDVVARSRTGTGKTFAFGIPLIERVVQNGLNRNSANDLPVVLILEPTRELAQQVSEELRSVCSKHRLSVAAFYGQSSYSDQVRRIRSGVHIVVGCPGRILDLIGRGDLKLDNIKHVVLDEGDTMLEMGFQKNVEDILLAVKKPQEAAALAKRSLSDDDVNSFFRDDRDSEENDDAEDEFSNLLSETAGSPKRNDIQLLLFSATMPGWICKLTDKLMKDPIFLDAVQEGETRLASTITHYAMSVPRNQERINAISGFLEDLILTRGEGGQTIVFTNTKEEADRLSMGNAFSQLRPSVLHGDISQHQRAATLRMFKEKKIDVLIATDVAARGLDIAGVDLVVHCAPPNDPDSYVHRSGRTGRAGRYGTAVLCYSPDEDRRLQQFQRELNFVFQRVAAPTVGEVIQASAKFSAMKLQRIDHDVSQYFLPYAKSLVQQVKEGKFIVEEEENYSEIDGEATKPVDPDQQLEILIAKCLAAISNRSKITTRSLLTGEEGKVTLKVQITTRTEIPMTVPSLQRITDGFLRKKLNMEDHKYHKLSLAKDETNNIVLLADFDSDTADEILERCASISMQGLSITRCETLPTLIEERSFDRGNDRGGSRYGGGDRGRGGGSGGGSSGGRSWQRRG